MTQETGSTRDIMTLTTRERIAEVRAAIHKLAVGRIKSYQLGRRTITYYDIKALKEYLRDLEDQLIAEEGDPALFAGTHVAFFDKR